MVCIAGFEDCLDHGEKKQSDRLTFVAGYHTFAPSLREEAEKRAMKAAIRLVIQPSITINTFWNFGSSSLSVAHQIHHLKRDKKSRPVLQMLNSPSLGAHKGPWSFLFHKMFLHA